MIDELLTYYDLHKRDLPWRKNHDPYRIWISEIMCQQTQVQTVIPYYNRFMEQFPDAFALADADEDVLMKCWQGLGYYSRAHNLQKAAQQIVKQFDGVFPTDYKEILSLNGIGDYTACAICSMAYNQPYVSIDGNFFRVFSRFYGNGEDISQPQTKERLKEKLLKEPIDRYGDFNQAVMDLGATICSPKAPLCLQCPLSKECIAHQNHNEEDYPVNLSKTKVQEVEITVLMIHQNGKYLIRKHQKKGLLNGLYEYPYFEKEMNEEQIQKNYNCLSIVKGKMKVHHFSHRKWNMTPFVIETANYQCKENELFVSKEELLSHYGMAKAFNQFSNLLD